MADFDVYVHGVPHGQDIWGGASDRTYIQGFYTHDDVKESVLFRIEVIQNKTFYSYLRYKNIKDNQNRAGSYFGITVGLLGRYCANVSLLYRIFDAVYNQICLNTIITSDNSGEKFLVSSFAEKTDVMNKIKTAFEQQIEKLLSGFLVNLDASVKQNGFVKFAFADVDSPYFVDNFKTHKIWVSTDYPSLDQANRNILAQVNPLNDKISQLNSSLSDWKGKAEQLDRNLADKKKEVENLKDSLCSAEKKLEDAKREISKDYKSKIDAMTNNIEELTKRLNKAARENTKLGNEKNVVQAEVDRLKKQLKPSMSHEELKKTISTIEPSISQIARLLASQFPDSGETGYGDDSNPDKDYKKRSIFSIKESWKNWLYLLLLILSLVILICFICLWNPTELNNPTPHADNEVIKSLKEDNAQLQLRIQDLEAKLNLPQNGVVEMQTPYDYSKAKRIDFVGGGPSMKVGESCALDVIGKDNISMTDIVGRWSVKGEPENCVSFNPDLKKLECKTSGMVTITFLDESGNTIPQITPRTITITH